MSAPVRINILLRIAVKCFIPTKDNYRAYIPIPRDTEEWNNMAGFCALSYSIGQIYLFEQGPLKGLYLYYSIPIPVLPFYRA
ncbi:MAG: hypothetical protein PWR14_618 [Thermosediminibacterales bacterium]|nr:hypothetical protein [Thermosediminibacterales bacterium]